MGLQEYNDKQDPPKTPYEHSNNSDETLVDSNNESVKRHEVTSVSCVYISGVALTHPPGS